MRLGDNKNLCRRVILEFDQLFYNFRIDIQGDQGLIVKELTPELCFMRSSLMTKAECPHGRVSMLFCDFCVSWSQMCCYTLLLKPIVRYDAMRFFGMYVDLNTLITTFNLDMARSPKNFRLSVGYDNYAWPEEYSTVQPRKVKHIVFNPYDVLLDEGNSPITMSFHDGAKMEGYCSNCGKVDLWDGESWPSYDTRDERLCFYKKCNRCVDWEGIYVSKFRATRCPGLLLGSGRGDMKHLPGGHMTQVAKMLAKDVSRLSLRSLIQYQDFGKIEMSADKTYVDTARLNHRGLGVSADEDHVSIRKPDGTKWEIKRSDFKTQRAWESKIRHIRHDYVSNLLKEDTDESFRLLGIDSPLTPDYIDRDRRCVLELATSASHMTDGLKRAFNSKLLAYGSICERNNLELMIVVVGMYSVMTNVQMPSQFVSELCLRMREAMSIESKISELMGRAIQGDEDGENTLREKKFKDVMDDLDKIPKPVKWCFNETLREESVRELTDVEKDWLKTKTHEAWLASTTKKQSGDIKMLESYYQSIRKMSTRSMIKRVSIFPFVIPKSKNIMSMTTKMPSNFEFPDMPLEMSTLWESASVHCKGSSYLKTPELSKAESMMEALSTNEPEIKHMSRKSLEFKSNMSEELKIKLALRGPGGKRYRDEYSNVLKEIESKIGFDPDVNTQDIKSFINEYRPDHKSECTDKAPGLPKLVRSLLADSKTSKRIKSRTFSLKLTDWSSKLFTSRHASFITSLCLELSYIYKVPDPPETWTIRPMRDYNCWILSQSTGTHVHFSLMCHRAEAELIDTGRLGPDFWMSDDWIIFDFSSIVEASLEHFLKTGPYTVLLSCYLLEHFRVPVIGGKINPSNSYYQTLHTLYLLYLNNKLDSEELITSCRYLYMRVLQEDDNDPYFFTERLPGVLRSRFSAYLLEKVTGMMHWMSKRPPRLVASRKKSGFRGQEYRYLGLRSIFHSDPCSFDQLIDSFYFGYVVSKSKGTVGDRSYKIMEKLIKEEFWYMDNIRKIDGELWNTGAGPRKHCWSMAYAKHCCDVTLGKLKRLHGSNFFSRLKEEIIHVWASKNFEDIATLKASARELESDDIVLPSRYDKTLTGRDFVKEFIQANPQYKGKRPRVLTNLIKLTRRVAKHLNKDASEVDLSDILRYSSIELIKRGWIYCDLFPKDQHGGDREIHVLEIMARIMQYFIELSSRVICAHINSDSIVHPKLKENFMRDHETAAQAKLGDHTTICKSADATKWCQRNHASKFYFMCNRMTNGSFDGFFYHFWYLWTEKRAMISPSLIAILDTSNFESSSNENLQRLKTCFKKGIDPMVRTLSCMVKVESGMWQGIPHITSSLHHSLCQEHARDYSQAKIESIGAKCVVSVIQGSDDSSCVISYVPDEAGIVEKYSKACLYWKEFMSQWLSIWTSEAKSSIGTRLMVEYNSEWWFCGKIVRPTFRWVSAALNMTVNESFYERYSVFYNQLTQCLTYGLSTLMAAVSQLCQGWLHYVIMGMTNHYLSQEIHDLLLDTKEPSCGYFLTDFDVSCGMPGLDFLLMEHVRAGYMKPSNIDRQEDLPLVSLEYDGYVDKTLRQDIRSVKLRMGNYKIHQRLVEELGIGTINEAIDFLESKPEVLFRKTYDWEDERAKILLKIFSPGVKASLSSYQPAIRTAVSSAYLFNRPCLVFEGQDGKSSLYRALNVIKEKQKNSSWKSTPVEVKMYFPHYDEMLETLTFIQQLDSSWQIQVGSLTRKHKVEVILWGNDHNSAPTLMDLCKKKWFHMNSVHVSNTTYNELWMQAKAKYPFLRDKCELTAEAMSCSKVAVRNFLISTEEKTRKLRLYDTDAKYPTLSSVVSRIFWPDIKLMGGPGSLEHGVRELRHNLFSICSYPWIQSKKITEISKLLQDSECLRTKIMTLPRRMQPLKVMSMVLMRDTPSRIKTCLELSKLGVVGYFVSKQSYAIGLQNKIPSSKGRMVPRMLGKGCWQGKIGSTSVRINLDGNKCTSIGIQGLTDALTLSKTLIELLNTFNCIIEGIPQISKSSLYLNDKGFFQASPLPLENNVAIDIDRDLKISDLSMADVSNARVLVENTTIKLVNDILLPNGLPCRVTICSYTSTNKDWDPTVLSSTGNISESDMFESWRYGQPCMLTNFCDIVGISCSSEDFSSLIMKIKDRKTKTLALGEHDLVQVRNYLLDRLMSVQGRPLEARISELPASVVSKMPVMTDSMLQDLKTLDEFDYKMPSEQFTSELRNDIQFTDVMVSRVEVDNWAEDDEEEEHELQGVEGELDEMQLIDIKETLFSQDTTHLDSRLADYVSKTSMPRANRFFDHFDILLGMEPRKAELMKLMDTSQPCVSKIKCLTQVGRVLSLARSEVVCEETQQVADSTVLSRERASLSISHGIHGDLDSRIKQLQESLAFLDQAISSSPPAILTLLNANRRSVIEELNRLSASPDTFRMIFNDYWKFWSVALKQIIDRGIWDKSELVTSEEELITIFMINCRERVLQRYDMGLMTEADRDERISSLVQPVVTQIQLDCAALMLEYNLYVDVEGEEDEEDILKNQVAKAEIPVSRGEVVIKIDKNILNKRADND